MKKIVVLFIMQIITVIAVEPADAQVNSAMQNSFGQIQQRGYWQNERSSMDSNNNATSGMSGYDESEYTAHIDNKTRSRVGAQTTFNKEQTQPYGFALSPLLGAPEDYSDSYEESADGMIELNIAVLDKIGNYRLTPEELMLAQPYAADEGRSPTSTGTGTEADITSSALSTARQESNWKNRHGMAQRVVSGLILQSPYSLYDLHTGADIYRSPW